MTTTITIDLPDSIESALRDGTPGRADAIGKVAMWVLWDLARAALSRPIQPGDRVSLRGSSATGKVKAVDDDYAWVQWPGTGCLTHRTNDLERIEQ